MEAPTAPNKLMAVDDDCDITLTLKRSFEQRGFSMDVYNDPIEALVNFKPNYYDLLLLDVKMPKMNGFELFQEINKMDRNTLPLSLILLPFVWSLYHTGLSEPATVYAHSSSGY